MRIGLSGMVLAMPAALLLSPQRVFAGSCCGGGTAGALLIPKSAKWLFAASGDFEKYNGYFDRGGKYLSDPPNSDLRQYRLNGGVAVRLASRWQAALASGYVFNSNKYSGLVSNTNAPADSVASLTYETFDNIRCVWRVRKWQDAIPAVYLASQLTLPTGVSPYDNVQSSFDITGRGFYRLEGKAIVEKTIYPFTLALTVLYGTHFARPVNRDYGLYVEPYRKRLGDRFTGTARLSTEQASQLGTLGYVARASGLDVDARRDHPQLELGPAFTVVTEPGGDVLARYRVRMRECAVSAAVIRDLLTRELPEPSPAWTLPGADQVPGLAGTGPLGWLGRPRSGVGLVEGWRGTICHRVELDDAGRLARVRVVDPSFVNWPALPVALADTIVPDFPLANKSFNQSYAGNDL